jgi:hypothetical protein
VATTCQGCRLKKGISEKLPSFENIGKDNPTHGIRYYFFCGGKGNDIKVLFLQKDPETKKKYNTWHTILLILLLPPISFN